MHVSLKTIFLLIFRFPLVDDQEIVELDWEVFLKETARLIVAKQTPETLLEARGRIYELLVHKIPAEIIFKVKFELFFNPPPYLKLLQKKKKTFYIVAGFIG